MSLIILVAIVVGVVWFVRSRRTQDQPFSSAKAAAQQNMQKAGASSSKLLARVRGRFDRSADHEAFKSWIISVVETVPEVGNGSDTFRAWLEGLAVADLRTFRNELAAFCHTLEIETDWLHSTTLSDRPELRRSLEETVGLFALAYANGASQQATIARTRTFQRWMAAPNRINNRGFGNKLYAALVTEGLIAPPAELLLAPERERRAFANQAIRETAAREPEAFDAVLASVLAPAAPAPAAEPSGEAVVIPAHSEGMSAKTT